MQRRTAVHGTYNTTVGREPPPRVAEALDLLTLGLSYLEIAARMRVSPHTTKHTLGAGYKMLGVRTARQAMALWTARRAEQGRTGGPRDEGRRSAPVP